MSGLAALIFAFVIFVPVNGPMILRPTTSDTTHMTVMMDDSTRPGPFLLERVAQEIQAAEVLSRSL